MEAVHNAERLKELQALPLNRKKTKISGNAAK